MPGVGWPELDAPVLVAGDAEADLASLVQALRQGAPRISPRLARGISAACFALRQTEYAAVVADVASVTDALALLRASGRGRPAARVICLLPADAPEIGLPHEYLERAAFAVRRHPVTPGDLGEIVIEAVAEYRQERGTEPASTRRDRDSWRAAERALHAALLALVDGAREGRGPHAGSPVAHAASRVVDAIQSRQPGGAGPALLHALAAALTPESSSGKEAA